MFPRFLLIWLLCFVLGFSASRGAEVLEGPQATALSPTSAVVRWRTDVPTGTRLTYGLSAERMNRSAEGALTDAHEVTLTDLQPGTNYFFAAGTARKQLATGQFMTSSSPAAATAPASSSPATSPAATPKPKSLITKIVGVIAPPKPASTQAPVQTMPAATNAPPTRQTWGNPGSLPDHFARHGGDFAAKSPDDYAAQAWRFRQRARGGSLLVKIDEDGTQRVFDPATGAFAAYNRDGTTKTFFKPGSRDYFNRQPGRPVKAITP